ncbi:MAG TPA: class I SAM-dependent methyltransferase [Vicinamibacterales bacterium]|nr:class I SAM-dependent methyltransferase [Vicinamibacterales bacterium]
MPILDLLRHPLNRLRQRWGWEVTDREQVFDRIFRDNIWGDSDSASGTGSNLEQTRVLRTALPALLERWHVRTMIDAPCGDFYWMSKTPLPVESYTGVDVVESLVKRNEALFGSPCRRFVRADLVRDPIPRADLVFCRDCLVHLSFSDAARALRNIRTSGASLLLTTTFTERQVNVDIRTGQWRPLNLCLPPFGFPPPVDVLVEHCTEDGGQYSDKSLGLWRLSDLPF